MLCPQFSLEPKLKFSLVCLTWFALLPVFPCPAATAPAPAPPAAPAPPSCRTDNGHFRQLSINNSCARHTHATATPPTRLQPLPPSSSHLTPPHLYCRPVFHLRFPCAGFPRTWHAIRKKAFVPCASASHDRYVRLLNYLLMPAWRAGGGGEGRAGGVTSQVQRRNITECVCPLPLSLWIRIQIEATNLNWPPPKSGYSPAL